jgi:hypothetical protein
MDELGSECCSLGGPDLFFVQCSDLGALQCSFQCSHGDSDLQSQCGTDRRTVLWPELGSECCSLGGPDLFFVQCSFQCSHGDSEMQSQCGTVLWPELGSECCTLGGPDLFSDQYSDLGAL